MLARKANASATLRRDLLLQRLATPLKNAFFRTVQETERLLPVRTTNAFARKTRPRLLLQQPAVPPKSVPSQIVLVRANLLPVKEASVYVRTQLMALLLLLWQSVTHLKSAPFLNALEMAR